MKRLDWIVAGIALATFLLGVVGTVLWTSLNFSLDMRVISEEGCVTEVQAKSLGIRLPFRLGIVRLPAMNKEVPMKTP